jgi:hypothetical protein
MRPDKQKQMMAYLTRPARQLVETGQLKFASDLAKPVDKFEVQQIKLFNDFNTRNPRADGGRIGFANGPPGQKIDKSKSKSAVRKPYASEIEKRIIELANNDKLGAEAIADKLTEEFEGNFSRSPVGKRIKILRAEGKIKNIPVKEKAASIAMRGDLYGQAPGEKYLKIREIRDVDRKAVDKSTGKSLYNIPENAKFKINFSNTAANQPDVISNIPEKFRGVQYFTTKKAAEKALAERKKLKLIGDEDLDPVKKSANKKKYDLIKEVSNNNIEDKLAEFKKGEPLEKAHRLSLEQVKKTGQLYNVMNLGLDFDSPEFVQINNESVKPFENKLKQLYAEQNKLYKQVKDLKVIPQDLQKKIEFNNKKISTVVDLAGGRVQGLQLDEFTLKPKVYGTNYANVLGFGLYDKPVKQLTKEDRAAIGLIMQGQVDNEKRTAGKTAQKLFANAQLLNDVDKLAVKSPPINQIENFLKNLENKKFGRVADVVVKASQEGGFGEAVQTICKRRKAKKGGRMFVSTGSGCPAAKDDPKGFLRSVSENPKLAKFLKSAPGKKAMTMAARVTGNVLNPTTLIGGEVAFVLGDGLNNFASGLPLDESFDRAFVFGDFGQFEKNLINQAKELGYDDNQLNLLQQTIDINKLDNRKRKLEYGLDVEKQDPSGLTSDATMGFENRLVNTNKNLDDSVINYLGTLDKMGFDRNKATDQMTGFTYLDNVFKKRTQDQLVKDFEDRKRQVDPTKTPFGDFISPVFDLGSYTQPLKFAADIVNPFTKDVPFLSERQQEAKKLREMSEEKLDAYNKARGFTIEDIQQGTSPQIRETMDYLGTDVTGQGFGQSLAGGGIAKLAGVSSGVAPAIRT